MADEKLTSGAEAPDVPAVEPISAAEEEERRLRERYDNSFNGTYSHSLDNKGRLIVPQAFREQLGDTFVIGPSYDFKSIALYPTLVWMRMRDQYAQLSSFDSRLKRFLTHFDAMSYRDQECDNQGRLLLPARIRQRLLGEEKEVDVLGNFDHVCIMTREKNEEDFEDFIDSMPGTLDRINELAVMQRGS